MRHKLDDPAVMTPPQRRHEIAAILTQGVFLGDDPINDLLPAQDFTLSSASGADWRPAIPEPGSASLLLLGGLALLRRQR